MPSNRPLYPGDSLATTEKLSALVNLHTLEAFPGLDWQDLELPAEVEVVFLWLRDGADSTWLCMGAEGTEDCTIRGSVINSCVAAQGPSSSAAADSAGAPALTPSGASGRRLRGDRLLPEEQDGR